MPSIIDMPFEPSMGAHRAFIQAHDSSSERALTCSLIVGDQDPQQLGAGEYLGYPVDTGTGCFCDFAVIRSVKPKALKASFAAKMESSESNSFNVFNIQVGRANLIAFRSGFGDGICGTFAAFDSEGRVSAVVTDF